MACGTASPMGTDGAIDSGVSRAAVAHTVASVGPYSLTSIVSGRRWKWRLAAPRATLASSVDKWLAGGRAAAVMAGAFCLSSNRGGVDEQGSVWAGSGWIIEPEEGELLARTSTDHPFVTLEIDLAAADAAKGTYPRYVPE